MSTCIEFCGKPKRKNLRPEGKLEDGKPQIPMSSSNKENQLKRDATLARLKYVQVKIND